MTLPKYNFDHNRCRPSGSRGHPERRRPPCYIGRRYGQVPLHYCPSSATSPPTQLSHTQDGEATIYTVMAQYKTPMVSAREGTTPVAYIGLTACNGHILVRARLSFISILSTRTDIRRRWHAHFYQPNKVAHNRWCNRSSTWLVRRPRQSFYVYEPRTRHNPPEHVAPNGTTLSNHRSHNRAISGLIMPPSGSFTCQHHRQRGG